LAERDSDIDLLVVGAGPTGLTLAVQARLMGASVRVIERRAEPRAWSPALAVHARTLEILRGLGVADRLVHRGITDVPLEIHFPGGVVTGRLHDLDLPETEFPFIMFVPQPDVEEALRERLAELGTDVEWGSELVDVDNREEGVVSRITTQTGSETILSRYVGGCDGAESAVRRSIGVGFPGRKYRQSIVVADTTIISDLASGTAHAFPKNDGMLFLFPLPSGTWRLIAPLRQTPADLPNLITTITAGRLQLGEVEWVTEIRPQHRLARRYRKASVFLAGDAAHVHSPAGAQGMNTGIQDAANLGWKIALAARGAPDSLLDTYETERRRVARHVVALTGLAFALEVSDAFPLRFGRRFLARPIASVLLPHPGLVSIVARVASGLDTTYPSGANDNAIHRGRCRPGARLPDAELGDGTRLHDLIDAASFHLLDVEESLDSRDRGRDEWLQVHTLTSDLLPHGRRWPRYVLVRPDGYVAACGDEAGVTDDYAAHWIHSARSGSAASELPTSSG